MNDNTQEEPSLSVDESPKPVVNESPIARFFTPLKKPVSTAAPAPQKIERTGNTVNTGDSNTSDIINTYWWICCICDDDCDVCDCDCDD